MFSRREMVWLYPCVPTYVRFISSLKVLKPLKIKYSVESYGFTMFMQDNYSPLQSNVQHWNPFQTELLRILRI